tara:strand:+ start:12969 stop:13772 length:804 start_codon:yes stop_codon:yes gene_type:complete
MTNSFPFKGSKERQKNGWKSTLDKDTAKFIQILFDVHNWSKKEQAKFFEIMLQEPEMWQDKYDVFRRTLDMKHYTNDRIEDDLSEHSFADWFKEEFDSDWDNLEAYLDDIQLERDNEKAGNNMIENMWKAVLQKEEDPMKRVRTTRSTGQDPKATERTMMNPSERELRQKIMDRNKKAATGKTTAFAIRNGLDPYIVVNGVRQLKDSETLEREAREKNAKRSMLKPSRDATTEASTPENAEIHRKKRDKAERERQMTGEQSTLERWS